MIRDHFTFGLSASCRFHGMAKSRGSPVECVIKVPKESRLVPTSAFSNPPHV